MRFLALAQVTHHPLLSPRLAPLSDWAMFNECRQFQALRRSDPIAGKGSGWALGRHVQMRAVTVARECECAL